MTRHTCVLQLFFIQPGFKSNAGWCFLQLWRTAWIVRIRDKGYFPPPVLILRAKTFAMSLDHVVAMILGVSLFWVWRSLTFINSQAPPISANITQYEVPSVTPPAPAPIHSAGHQPLWKKQRILLGNQGSSYRMIWPLLLLLPHTSTYGSSATSVVL